MEQVQLTQEQKELASKLTNLQRKYIIELVKPNTTQRQAYLKAGGKAKTETAQNQSASEILSNPNVKAFYESLINEKTKKSIMTRDEALIVLAEIINDKENSPRDRTGAIKQFSTMQGWDSATKHEIKGDLEVTKITRKVVNNSQK